MTHPAPEPQADDKPLVAATMFGVTTACVERAREILERAGFEVLVFHATGNGGQAMESLISEGLIAGVLDITTTELADEQVGGFLSAGPDRLTAAGKAGIPQVVSTGALDMANFYAPDSVPAKFKDRLFYKHNANVTLMRTTPEENAQIGAGIARKLSAATGPVAVLLPKRGVSAIDKQGQPFDDPAARKALHDAVRSGLERLRPRRASEASRAAASGGGAPRAVRIDVTELDLHINDPEFADAAARKLIELMRQRDQEDQRGQEVLFNNKQDLLIS